MRSALLHFKAKISFYKALPPFRVIFLLIVFISALPDYLVGQSAAIRINEFMASNQATVVDEDNEFSDWIEVFNPTTNAVNLLGWSLTDDQEAHQKWQFPDIVIQPNTYLVIFASGKNRVPISEELHTNFKRNPFCGINKFISQKLNKKES